MPIPSPSPKRKQVALLIETSNAYARGILEGIVEYQMHRDRWSVFLPELERGAPPPKWMETWRGDGIIARIENDSIADFVLTKSLPTIDVSAARRIPSIPWVETDDQRVADLAYEHLRERGFQQFAYCGPKGFNWSLWRCEHFLHRCRVDRFQPSVFWSNSLSRVHDMSVAGSIEAQESLTDAAEMGKWLESLPKPVGLFCGLDIQAQIVLDRCRNLNIQVPDQIAVVGVDNDSIVCNLSHPSLTSIIPNAKGAGYYAAEILDQWMSRPKSRNSADDVLAQSRLFPPIGIQARRSTDITAVAVPEIAMAIRFIQENACKGIDVRDLLVHVPLSRRRLEYQFLESTGITPHELITRVRMERAKTLLLDSELSLEQIAAQCGYEHSEYLSVVFKKRFQITPARYRRSERNARLT